MCVESECVRAGQVTQLDRDTVLIALEGQYAIPYLLIKYFKCFYCIFYLTISFVSFTVGMVKIVDLQGVPSMELASEMEFGFPIETLGKRKQN